MKMEIVEESGVTIIKMTGTFDAASTRDVKEKFSTLLGKDNFNFVVDLAGVDFIDSSGLGALVGFFKKVRLGEGDVRLAGVSAPIMKILQLTHLDKVFKIEKSAS